MGYDIPPPTTWCEYFTKYALKAIETKDSWRPMYDCVDYFISILPFAYHSYYRDDIKLKELMQLMDKTLAEGEVEGELLEFLQTLKAREQDIWAAWDIGEQKIAAGLEAPRED